MLIDSLYIIQSEDDTINVIKEFKNILKPGDVVVLNGELGTGKTFFVKHLCKLFKINNVTSPTFSIVNQYEGEFKVYHFDFYRLNNEDELLDIAFTDYISDNEAIVFIEWGNLFPRTLPNNYYDINISFIDDEKREIKIKSVISE